MDQHVLDFWFEELQPKDWFMVNPEVDQHIQQRFAPLVEQAAQCELFHWRKSAHGRLAEIIVLDQFSRNIYRNTPRAFSQDPLALALAQEAISIGADQALSVEQRAFLYMPYMHSESAQIHQQAVTLFNQPGMENNYDFELKHKVIIDRFGRYPHRNEILGRPSSDEELEFLAQPNSRF
ncbi:DUF924 family protein [Vibrio panuliri]|uniref:DUF924 domain-containing protein n=1 Tax=Vibrio panuliri TaxID=1381081 RepID=A0ABX3F6D6_9VIBR|nr:DUF924 family protein [Vibrio panuliri]KAB1457775.1 DUF924 domain-containing protein [Vibrio panuliri]OLQ85742.1 hypothetical protein BIY20_02830 [Vibrio panuliri]